jgi:hypothetical protein
VGLGWWPEIRRDFALSLSPTFVASGHVGASVGLQLTPSIGMQSAGHSPAAFGLSFSPSVSVTRLSFPATASLVLMPSLSFTGAELYTRSFGLTLTPQIGMSAVAAGLPYTIPFNVIG